MMEYKKAMGILKNLLGKYKFDAEEKKAIWTAIGTLDWGALAKNRVKRIIEAKKAKRKKDLE